LPKGYQISQYDKPLVEGGHLDIADSGEKTSRIRIRRVHLEEDTGKLIHPKGADYSLVDLNRAGVPLMELVTEPDFKTGAQARKFCQELQIILRYLGVSDADMEKGQMRCEVNISVSDTKEFGTKVEIKNLNSFRAVEKSIDYEIKRQSEELEAGKKIIQETRGWEDASGITKSQREKEEAHDYRYFPEPDLPPLVGLDKLAEKLRSEMPELPKEKSVRFVKEFGLPNNDIGIIVQDKNLSDYFEEICSELSRTEDQEKISAGDLKKLYKLTANYLLTEIPKIAALAQAAEFKLSQKITPENFAEFVILTWQDKISSSGAQTLLAEMFKTGADPTHIIDEMDLGQVSDENALYSIAQKIIGVNQKTVADYKKGNVNALQFLVGQVMKESKGKANPKIAQDLLKNLLD